MPPRTQHPNRRRCWRYIAECCRADATSSVRIGDLVYQFCADPAHDPRRYKR